MKKKAKSFDAVNFMRQARNRLSRKLNRMSPEEQIQDLKDKVGDKIKPPSEPGPRKL